MNVLISIAGAVGFVASACTIVLFAEDRIERFRRRRRGKKMMEKERG